jgi:hypothetical protein
MRQFEQERGLEPTDLAECESDERVAQEDQEVPRETTSTS